MESDRQIWGFSGLENHWFDSPRDIFWKKDGKPASGCYFEMQTWYVLPFNFGPR